ncbi:MAG: hypothetical protein IE916_08335 [Epsilonproteobacteria bacterium]|nr:hypothetical protein [Campylobacterota bacterium]
MQPLLAPKLTDFLKRFDSFRGSEVISFQIVSPTVIELLMRVQDAHRDFDWIELTLQFNGISDARLIENEKMSLIDMSDGVTLKNDGSKFAFGIGAGYNVANISDSICYILANSIKYKESMF